MHLLNGIDIAFYPGFLTGRRAEGAGP